MPKSYGRKDNKPMTLKDFLVVLGQLQQENPKAYGKIINKPIKMSCDEEGNGFGKLYSVEIGSEITLWPADAVMG